MISISTLIFFYAILSIHLLASSILLVFLLVFSIATSSIDKTSTPDNFLIPRNGWITCCLLILPSNLFFYSSNLYKGWYQKGVKRPEPPEYWGV